MLTEEGRRRTCTFDDAASRSFTGSGVAVAGPYKPTDDDIEATPTNARQTCPPRPVPMAATLRRCTATAPWVPWQLFIVDQPGDRTPRA